MRFFRLSISEKIFLAHCIIVLCVIRLALSLKSASFIMRKISAIHVTEDGDQKSSSMVAWGVGACSNYVPGATCLTQALAGQYLMARHNYRSIVRIGIERDDHKNIKAHAWLLSGGFVVLGGKASDMPLYATMVDL
ncbi:lasso peptide biosynthesis B2 protein [Pararhizobium sp. IMCC21322]|uniref:lasso peptide biosynthesis B2 protein n=1 Tax=Pararhizobium sp. IMCC21322 TaxID=3067903 RepID=UPI0027425E40|nr:lasso peptide biosynthesis B2 protein [Pararhizobium sp. IMCC21322]